MKKSAIILCMFLCLGFAYQANAQIKKIEEVKTVPKKVKKSEKEEKTEVKQVKNDKNSMPLETTEKLAMAANLKAFTSMQVGRPTDKAGLRRLRLVNDNFSTDETSTTDKISSNTEEKICTETDLNVKLDSRDIKQFSYDGEPDWLKPGILMKARS